MKQALEYLRAGEVVGIFPEATISRSFEIKELKSGAVRIAAEAGVPLIPVCIWGTQRIMTKDHPRDLSRGKTIAVHVGEPLHPKALDPVAETAELSQALRDLLAQTIKDYPADGAAAGVLVATASYGGTAPTPERALELDAEEKRARALKKAARQSDS